MLRAQVVSWIVCFALLSGFLCAGFVCRSKPPQAFLTVLPIRRDLVGVYTFAKVPSSYSIRGEGKLVLHLDGSLESTGGELVLCEGQGREKTVVQTIIPAIRHDGKWEVVGDTIRLTWTVNVDPPTTDGAFLRVKRDTIGFLLCPDLGFDYCVAPLYPET